MGPVKERCKPDSLDYMQANKKGEKERLEKRIPVRYGGHATVGATENRKRKGESR